MEIPFLGMNKLPKKDKDWLYLQMIKAITKVKDSIILVFSPIKLQVNKLYENITTKGKDITVEDYSR